MLAISTSASAAIISWGLPQTISGDSDVSTNGTLLHSVNFANGGGPITVNGVDFANAGRFTSRPNEWAIGGGWSPSNGVGSASAPFADLSEEYQFLVGRGYFRNNAVNPTGATATLTLLSLTPGTPYELQIWFNNSQAGAAGRNLIVDGEVNPFLNVSGQEGGLGTFITGTFVADDTNQMINLASNDPATPWNINAYQLRVIPEPSTLALIGTAFGLGVLLFRRR